MLFNHRLICNFVFVSCINGRLAARVTDNLWLHSIINQTLHNVKRQHQVVEMLEEQYKQQR